MVNRISRGKIREIIKLCEAGISIRKITVEFYAS
jgi:hypothetical protein